MKRNLNESNFTNANQREWIPGLRTLIENKVKESAFDLNHQKISVMDILNECGPEVSAKLLSDGMKFVEEINRISILMHKSDKSDIEMSVCDIPCISAFNRTTIPRTADRNSFLCVNGIIKRTKLPKLVNHFVVAQCKRCKFKHRIYNQKNFHNEVILPAYCGECGNQKPRFLIDDSVPNGKRDCQEVLLQELNVSRLTKSIWVQLEGHNVDICKVGDVVAVKFDGQKDWNANSIYLQAP
ncbi:hypothetical protein GJ496_010428 [Pomphorhynchus laevis]|nr:hypothetical protein GJ496_010428 [Pomphorhynchus laevis]